MTMGRNVPPRMKPVTAPPRPMDSVAAYPMASDSHPPMGWQMNRATKVAMRTTRSGVRKRSNISGMTRCSFFSSREAKRTTRMTAMMPPRPGTRGWPEKTIWASPGWVMIAAMTPPSMGEPPKTLAALTPTKILRP